MIVELLYFQTDAKSKYQWRPFFRYFTSLYSKYKNFSSFSILVDSTYTPVRENITNNQTKSFIPKDTSSRDKSHVPFLEMEYQSASSDVRFKIKRKYCEIWT